MKQKLIAEILGRLYVRKNARTHKVVGLASAVHDSCKLVSVRRLPCERLVSGTITGTDRRKPVRRCNLEPVNKGSVRDSTR